MAQSPPSWALQLASGSTLRLQSGIGARSTRISAPARKMAPRLVATWSTAPQPAERAAAHRLRCSSFAVVDQRCSSQLAPPLADAVLLRLAARSPHGGAAACDPQDGIASRGVALLFAPRVTGSQLAEWPRSRQRLTGRRCGPQDGTTLEAHRGLQSLRAGYGRQCATYRSSGRPCGCHNMC